MLLVCPNVFCWNYQIIQIVHCMYDSKDGTLHVACQTHVQMFPVLYIMLQPCRHLRASSVISLFLLNFAHFSLLHLFSFCSLMYQHPLPLDIQTCLLGVMFPFGTIYPNWLFYVHYISSCFDMHTLKEATGCRITFIELTWPWSYFLYTNWRFAGLGAGLAWGTLQESAKRIAFGTPGSQNNQHAVSPFLSEKNAERLALALCRMRGAALKLGQMLSIQDESLVPAPVYKFEFICIYLWWIMKALCLDVLSVSTTPSYFFFVR